MRVYNSQQEGKGWINKVKVEMVEEKEGKSKINDLTTTIVRSAIL